MHYGSIKFSTTTCAYRALAIRFLSRNDASGDVLLSSFTAIKKNKHDSFSYLPNIFQNIWYIQLYYMIVYIFYSKMYTINWWFQTAAKTPLQITQSGFGFGFSRVKYKNVSKWSLLYFQFLPFFPHSVRILFNSFISGETVAHYNKTTTKFYQYNFQYFHLVLVTNQGLM